MWHYTEGVRNWDPIWPQHAIRILPGPPSLWFDALGRRLPDPCLPGFNTLATLKHLRTTPDIAGYDHSWFITTQRIVRKEFGLSGSEQNSDITSRDKRAFVRQRILNKAAPDPVEAFKRHGQDFVVADRLEELVAGAPGRRNGARPLLRLRNDRPGRSFPRPQDGRDRAERRVLPARQEATPGHWPRTPDPCPARSQPVSTVASSRANLPPRSAQGAQRAGDGNR
jgi:FAD binding domain-containing protein